MHLLHTNLKFKVKMEIIMKKKIVALMLAVTTVCMTACGNAEETPNDVVESVVEDTVVEEVSEAAEEEATTVVEEETETTLEEQTEVVTEEADDEVADEATEAEVAEGGYLPGTFTDTGYESEYLGFRYTTPEGFNLATKEELDQAMGEAIEFLDEDYTEVQKMYAQMVTIYEMMVSDEFGIVNANIALEKASVGLDAYLEAFTSQITQLTIMDVTLSDTVEEVELAGAAYTKLSAEVEAEGYLMKQEYYFREVDDRIMAITVTWMDEYADKKEALMNGFAAY